VTCPYLQPTDNIFKTNGKKAFSVDIDVRATIACQDIKWRNRMSTSTIWLLLIFIPIMLWLRYSDNYKLANAFKAAGEKYNGSVTDVGMFSQISLSIPYKGNVLIITCARYRRGPDIYFAVLTLPEPHFPEITLGTNSILQKSVGNFGSDRVLTGDERFDFLFIVRSQDRSAVMKVLTEKVRENLKSKPFYTPLFAFAPAKFSMSTTLTGYSQRSDACAVFVDTIISMLDTAWR
jgi:hypothetical protein